MVTKISGLKIYKFTTATRAHDMANLFYIETTANEIRKMPNGYEVGKRSRGVYSPLAFFGFEL